jgi:PAS domain-containing protein
MIDKPEPAAIDSGVEHEAADIVPKPDPHASLCSFAELFQQLPVPCVETTRVGVIRRVNDEAARLFNVPRAFLIAKPLVHFVARGDCKVFRTAVERVGDGKPLDRITVRFRPRHGPPVAPAKLSGRCLSGIFPPTIVWVVDPMT